MALDVTLSNYSGGTTYSLSAETVEHEVSRMPIASALPAGGVILLDLGLYLETITVTGTCVEYDSVVANPDKIKLRAGAVSWYTNIKDHGYSVLRLNSYESYTGVIKAFHFRQEAAEDPLSFSLVFQVKAVV